MTNLDLFRAVVAWQQANYAHHPIQEIRLRLFGGQRVRLWVPPDLPAAPPKQPEPKSPPPDRR